MISSLNPHQQCKPVCILQHVLVTGQKDTVHCTRLCWVGKCTWGSSPSDCSNVCPIRFPSPNSDSTLIRQNRPHIIVLSFYWNCYLISPPKTFTQIDHLQFRLADPLFTATCGWISRPWASDSPVPDKESFLNCVIIQLYNNSNLIAPLQPTKRWIDVRQCRPFNVLW